MFILVLIESTKYQLVILVERFNMVCRDKLKTVVILLS